jgi:hypothetical protein
MVACKPILHGMEPLARSRGEALAAEYGGVLVYAQDADVDRGEYSTPVILAKYGDVPHPEEQSLSRQVAGADLVGEAWQHLPPISGHYVQEL